MMKAAVLFVCLGNICRSPLAEAALRREAEAVGLEVEIDSAGTGDWHIGHPPDARALAKAKAEGIDRSEEHTSELQSLMRRSYAVFCFKKKKDKKDTSNDT